MCERWRGTRAREKKREGKGRERDFLGETPGLDRESHLELLTYRDCMRWTQPSDAREQALGIIFCNAR